jgi:hypothetical protein
MATVINPLGALAGALLKVILPIVLGSLIFAGILAQYNNQMRLNKTILESYYQPMKEQSRKCFRLHAELQRKLAEYRGLIDEIRGLIVHGTKPPPELLKQPGDPTFPAKPHRRDTASLERPGGLRSPLHRLSVRHLHHARSGRGRP